MNGSLLNLYYSSSVCVCVFAVPPRWLFVPHEVVGCLLGVKRGVCLSLFCQGGEKRVAAWH